MSTVIERGPWRSSSYYEVRGVVVRLEVKHGFTDDVEFRCIICKDPLRTLREKPVLCSKVECQIMISLKK